MSLKRLQPGTDHFQEYIIIELFLLASRSGGYQSNSLSVVPPEVKDKLSIS